MKKIHPFFRKQKKFLVWLGERSEDWIEYADIPERYGTTVTIMTYRGLIESKLTDYGVYYRLTAEGKRKVTLWRSLLRNSTSGSRRKT